MHDTAIFGCIIIVYLQRNREFHCFEIVHCIIFIENYYVKLTYFIIIYHYILWTYYNIKQATVSSIHTGQCWSSELEELL